jgi:hypothetical protein
VTTVSALIDQIASHLHGFTDIIEPTTYLTAPCDNDDTVLSVQHGTKITQGYVEVDDELIHVDTVGGASFTTMPFGRGVSGSTAASHAAGARVINDPQFPRVRIFDALKRAILQVQPDLFTVKSSTFTSSPVQTTYEIPADVDRVLKVQYQVIGPSQEWLTISGWTVDQDADTASGKAIVLYTPVQSGRTVQVIYAGPYTNPTTTSDDLEATCKIPASAHDVLMWNVCWQLVQFMEIKRVDMRAVEQQARAQGVAVGDPSKIAKQLYAMYELRKGEERRRLLTTHPAVKRFVAR